MGKRSKKVNKNKSGTSVSSCKGCLCHLSSFVFLLPTLSPPLTFQVSVTRKVLKVWQTQQASQASQHPSSFAMPEADELQVWPTQYSAGQIKKLPLFPCHRKLAATVLKFGSMSQIKSVSCVVTFS